MRERERWRRILLFQIALFRTFAMEVGRRPLAELDANHLPANNVIFKPNKFRDLFSSSDSDGGEDTTAPLGGDAL